jgi:hypothetical protein
MATFSKVGELGMIIGHKLFIFVIVQLLLKHFDGDKSKLLPGQVL